MHSQPADVTQIKNCHSSKNQIFARVWFVRLIGCCGSKWSQGGNCTVSTLHPAPFSLLWSLSCPSDYMVSGRWWFSVVQPRPMCRRWHFIGLLWRVGRCNHVRTFFNLTCHVSFPASWKELPRPCTVIVMVGEEKHDSYAGLLWRRQWIYLQRGKSAIVPPGKVPHPLEGPN